MQWMSDKKSSYFVVTSIIDSSRLSSLQCWTLIMWVLIRLLWCLNFNCSFIVGCIHPNQFHSSKSLLQQVLVYTTSLLHMDQLVHYVRCLHLPNQVLRYSSSLSDSSWKLDKTWTSSDSRSATKLEQESNISLWELREIFWRGLQVNKWMHKRISSWRKSPKVLCSLQESIDALLNYLHNSSLYRVGSTNTNILQSRISIHHKYRFAFDHKLLHTF